MQLEAMAAPERRRNGNGDQLDRLHVQGRASENGIVVKHLGDEDLWVILHELEDIRDLTVGVLDDL